MEFLIILVLILFNGVFSMSEIAVVSARKARLQDWANRGDERAAAALLLAEEPGRFLSTVQVGITLIGTLLGAFSGATIADDVAVYLRRVPALAPYSETLSLLLVVMLITYLSLVIGELVPKQLGLLNPERTASLIAGPMSLLSRIAGPVVRLLTASTNLVVRLLGVKGTEEPPVTEEEITVLVNQGTEAGVFEEEEQELIRGVFRLGDTAAGGLMTPRLEISWLDLEAPPDENVRRIEETAHSRFPVGRGSLDGVVGMVYAKDLLVRSLAGKPFDLTASLVPPLYVPESASAFQLLELYKQSRAHTALVVDEYGSIQGLTTLTDVLEAIVGEMPSANEPFDPDIVQREDGSWLLDGLVGIDEFKDLLHIRDLPDEERRDYQTLGGFILMRLGHIPAAGEHFNWGGWRFEVLDMDGHRIDKVLVSPLVETEDRDGTRNR